MLLILSGTVLAQSLPSVTPTPTPVPGSRQTLNPGLHEKGSYERLRTIEAVGERERRPPPDLLTRRDNIYRKPSKDEVAALAVSEQLSAKYAEFLRMNDAGLVKLSSDFSCVGTSDVVVASDQCLPLRMPGAGTAFSFRTESYRLPRLADVILLDGKIMTGGLFQQVIITNIGDTAIENITLESSGLKYLISVKPAVDSNEFMQFDSKLLDGIEANGVLYRKNEMAALNTAYALRSIAYRGKSLRTLDGYLYNELEFDKRRDIIVVFRIVEMEPNGNVTILWKKLKDVEAPVLKVLKLPGQK